MTDNDIVNIYHNLSNRYSLILTSSLAVGFKTTIDFPILRGTSSLGNFEMFVDDFPSFAFYAMRDNGDVFAHKHLQSIVEAKQAVADFMEGTLTLISFGQPYDN